MKDKKHKGLKITLVIIVAALIVVAGYVFFISHLGGVSANGNFKRPPFGNMQNFSLSDSAKNSTLAFFASSPSINDTMAYCQQNRINCFYYCTQIDSSQGFCSQLRMMGMRNFTGNYSRWRNYTRP